jgi:4'-phosphopantetheinyl transferase
LPNFGQAWFGKLVGCKRFVRFFCSRNWLVTVYARWDTYLNRNLKADNTSILNEVLIERVLPNAIENYAHQVYQVLSHRELNRAMNIKSRERAGLYLSVHAALRITLGKLLNVPPKEIPIVTGPFGKPMLGPPHHQSGLNFSLSRTRGMALVAIANGLVGVDVEFVRAVSDVEHLLVREFTEEERNLILEEPENKRSRRFLEFWTAKEAGLKGLGIGLTAPVASARAICGIDGRICGIDLEEACAGAGSWIAEALPVGPSHVASIAVLKKAGRRTKVFPQLIKGSGVNIAKGVRSAC